MFIIFKVLHFKSMHKIEWFIPYNNKVTKIGTVNQSQFTKIGTVKFQNLN